MMNADKVKRDTPNVLLITCDQLRYDAIAEGFVSTPNIDSLRNDGVFFTNCYSQTPVCIPARHSLISGQDAFSLGLSENASTRLPVRYPLPELIRERGYFTCAVGKMHFIPTREHFGFDRMYLSEEIPSYVQDDDYLTWLRKNGCTNVFEPHGKRSETYYVPQESVLHEANHSTAWTGRVSSEIIRENKDRPFFLFSSFIKPHPPFDPCKPYSEMYDPETVPYPPIPTDQASGFDNAISIQNGYKVNGWDNVTEKQIRKIRAYYYGCITQIDTAIGNIIASLKESGQYDQTLIILTTDHGEMLGDHGSFGKRTYYEQSCHIPLIAVYPRMFKRKSTCDRLITLTDIYATLLTAVGGCVPDICSGIEFFGNCLSDCSDITNLKERKSIVAQYGAGQDFKVMLRRENCKYIYYANGKREVLYDLATDPQELHPILHSVYFPDYQAEIKTYFREYGFSEAFQNGQLVGYDEYIAPKIPGYLNQFPEWPSHIN